MNAPRDELMSTSQEDVDREHRRRRRLGYTGCALLFAALLIAIAWLLTGCASAQLAPESPLAKELRWRWARQEARTLAQAQEGVVFESPR
jgi:hypothetical protein